MGQPTSTSMQGNPADGRRPDEGPGSTANTPAPSTSSRSPVLGFIDGLARACSERDSLEMFRRVCTTRHFELELARVFDTGVIKAPIYLSLGQEQIAAAIATVSTDFLVFGQHRCHAYYISFGGDLGRLADELLHRETGCARGMGGSASIHEPAIGMFGHSGLMGDQVPIAVGAALGSSRCVLTVVGDAAVEEDYVWSAMGYAATKKLPVLLVCEDNDRSILTPVATRRSWNIVDVARSLGIRSAADIADDPWLVAHYTRRFLGDLPAVLNVRTCRDRWHAGTGRDGDPEWDRFELTKRELKALGLEGPAARIEEEARRLAEGLWHERLRTQSPR